MGTSLIEKGLETQSESGAVAGNLRQQQIKAITQLLTGGANAASGLGNTDAYSAADIAGTGGGSGGFLDMIKGWI